MVSALGALRAQAIQLKRSEMDGCVTQLLAMTKPCSSPFHPSARACRDPPAMTMRGGDYRCRARDRSIWKNHKLAFGAQRQTT